MTYVRKNVNKSAVPGAGAATPKDPNVAIFKAQDIISMPVRNGAGVLAEGTFIMKPGFAPIYIYMTGVNQNFGYETEGEVDKEQILQSFVGQHPGDTLDVHEFVQNHLGEDLIIVIGSCNDQYKRILGSKCAPLRLKNNFTSNNEGNTSEMTFEPTQATRFVPAWWIGNVPYAQPFTVPAETIDALKANGYQYQLGPFAVTDDLEIASIDLEHGDRLTLLGGGGEAPATLTEGTAGVAEVLLKDGTVWTALAGATITLEVFEADSDTYLIERDRT